MTARERQTPIERMQAETPAQRAAQARFDVDVYPKVAAVARRRGMSMATFLRTLALRELALEEETRRQNSAVIIPSEILEVEE